MGRGKEQAKERREKRLQEISLLRTIPYSDHQRWWSIETIVVVTGGNRGIGFEISRQLAAHGMKVVLTSRDSNVGLEAAKVLQEVGLNVFFHQLDILDPASIKEFAEWIQGNYGGLDILVNNAGVNFNVGSDNSVEFAEQRIQNVTLREQLSNVDSLTEELIDNMVTTFVEQAKDGSWVTGGWPQSFTDYSVSKLAINCYTRLMARKLSDRPEGEKIFINCYCPGWVKTAMTGWVGNISVEDGADTGVWLALLPGQPASGKFFAERREINF
ncbi:hypothetical protein Ancab_035498 [Ancistrocladus abbreviatus]